MMAEISDLRATLAKQAEAAPVGAGERAAFEAWFDGTVSRANAWDAWKARAAIGEPRPVAPVALTDAEVLAKIMRPYGIYDVAVSHAGALQLEFIEIGKQARAILATKSAPVAEVQRGGKA